MTVDKRDLALALFWTAFTLYFLLSLFPPVMGQFRQWKTQSKGPGRIRIHVPSRPQRFVMVLLFALMSAELYAAAFHRDFTKLTGISPQTVFILTIGLPALYFLLPLFEKCFRKQ